MVLSHIAYSSIWVDIYNFSEEQYLDMGLRVNVYLSQTLPWLKITSTSKVRPGQKNPAHEQMRYCLIYN